MKKQVKVEKQVKVKDKVKVKKTVTRDEYVVELFN
jgi:hypothetical protein